MSQYYNPKRNSDWNYGGRSWRLSRSKIDLYLNCKRCFYIDNKLGATRPKGFPFNLNSAVDTLLKKEFDIHRAAGTVHPLAKAYGVDAVPFADPRMDEWRDALKRGIRYLHKPTNLLVSGGVDDVWVTPNKELLIVDYKATAKEGDVSLDADWQDGYKNQMEIYQWLFRQNGFKVSDTGYFVYVNGLTDRKAFDGRLEFDVKLIPYTGNTDWIEQILQDIKKCLDNPEIPEAAASCDYCAYTKTIAEVGKPKTHISHLKAEPKESKQKIVNPRPTLF